MLDYVLAIGHHLLIFALFGILVAEFVLVRPGIDAQAVARTAAVDIWYGVLAAAIVVLGFARAIFAAKGWPYYEHNVYFWAKIATFAIIAVLSVPPTIRYVRWRRTETVPVEVEISAVRRYLWMELALFALLPVFAAAMARGFGERGY